MKRHFLSAFALLVMILLAFGSRDSSDSSYDSVREDMDKFDSHFPNASEEERRLTEELFEEDSRRRGY